MTLDLETLKREAQDVLASDLRVLGYKEFEQVLDEKGRFLFKKRVTGPIPWHYIIEFRADGNSTQDLFELRVYLYRATFDYIMYPKNRTTG